MPGARISTTLRPGSTSSSWLRASSVSTGSSRSNAASGSASRRVCTATASPFSSTNASSAPSRRSSRGSSRRNVASPCGGRGETTRRLVEDQRSLPYCPKTVQLAAVLPDRVADLVEAAEGEHLAGRAAGDHRDRADVARPGRRAASGASGWMWAASGSSTIGESVPSKSSPTTRESAALTTAA